MIYQLRKNSIYVQYSSGSSSDGSLTNPGITAPLPLRRSSSSGLQEGIWLGCSSRASVQNSWCVLGALNVLPPSAHLWSTCHSCCPCSSQHNFLQQSSGQQQFVSCCSFILLCNSEVSAAAMAALNVPSQPARQQECSCLFNGALFDVKTIH